MIVEEDSYMKPVRLRVPTFRLIKWHFVVVSMVFALFTGAVFYFAGRGSSTQSHKKLVLFSTNADTVPLREIWFVEANKPPLRLWSGTAVTGKRIESQLTLKSLSRANQLRFRFDTGDVREIVLPTISFEDRADQWVQQGNIEHRTKSPVLEVKVSRDNSHSRFLADWDMILR